MRDLGGQSVPRRRSFPVLGFGACGGLAAALGLTALRAPPPLVVWNASASLPIGLYMVRPGVPMRRGDVVVARLPQDVRALAAKRGYVPARVPILKRVAALPGDLVCARGAVILINGRAAAWRRGTDGAGRPLTWWSGCGPLQRSVLLLGDDPGSFDGRYFGPIGAGRVVGTARPI